MVVRCLAIESSCDESAVALLEDDGANISILAEEISSQSAVHELYGGVVPELASREHLRALPLMIAGLQRKFDGLLDRLDLVAVTRGPGLKGCLLMGLGVAKGLALSRGIPLLGINHIEGHVHSARINNPDLAFPYLCLVVSGGHTEIVEVRGVGMYRILSRTADDAAGEAFDKAAALLGIPYPGGAALARRADEYRARGGAVDNKTVSLPKVMRGSTDFSFSGLKTAIRLLIEREQGRDSGALAMVIQEAIIDSLVEKLRDAMERTGLHSVALCGGVSANARLRERAAELPRVRLFLPKSLHCTDYATMIGFVALERFRRGERGKLDLHALSRWPVEEMCA